MTGTYLHQHPPMARNPLYLQRGDMHGTPFIRESVQRKPYLCAPSFRLLRRPNKAAVKVRRRLRMAMRMFDFARFNLWLAGDPFDHLLALYYRRRLQALRARL